MKFDASQFDNLELENIGQWPAAAKLLLAIFVGVAVLFGGYFFLVSDKIDLLDRVQKEEVKLSSHIGSKYHIAANLDCSELK